MGVRMISSALVSQFTLVLIMISVTAILMLLKSSITTTLVALVVACDFST